MTNVDWSWKLREAVERIRTGYDHIGRTTGAPFLAVVYPPEAETAVLKEWATLAETLAPEFDVRKVDVLDVTMAVVGDLGVENIVATIRDPMPGSNPDSELGSLWVKAVLAAVREAAQDTATSRVVVALERIAALYPATGPRALMQDLWDSAQSSLDGPVVFLIPGTLLQPRVYSFLNLRHEVMYRGDIL